MKFWHFVRVKTDMKIIDIKTTEHELQAQDNRTIFLNRSHIIIEKHIINDH